MTSSEPFDRSGPVPAAVRAAGYITEDEDSEEEGGSSVEEESEEEEEEEEMEDAHQHHGHATQTPAAFSEAPGYSAPVEGSGIQVGPSGYALEKKVGGEGPVSGGEPSGLARKASRKEEVSFNFFVSQSSSLTDSLCRSLPRSPPPLPKERQRRQRRRRRRRSQKPPTPVFSHESQASSSVPTLPRRP